MHTNTINAVSAHLDDDEHLTTETLSITHHQNHHQNVAPSVIHGTLVVGSTCKFDSSTSWLTYTQLNFYLFTHKKS